MNLTQKRWFLLAESCLVNLCIGSLYAWSVFVSPMTEHLGRISGRRIADLAIIFTVANIVGPVMTLTAGFINDRIGPRLVILAGGFLFGGGMFLSGFASSTGMFMLTYGVIVSLANGMIYSCTVSNVVKFFPDRRGLAGGLATAFYGISSVLVPPVANYLNNVFGVTTTFKILGVVMFAIISPAALFIVRCPPGFMPEGWQPPLNDVRQKDNDKDWKAMIKDPVFYIMILILCCGAFSGLMIISQISPMAQRMIGMNTAAAAFAVSVLALLNVCGRIMAGYLSDKFGIIKILAGAFFLSIIGLVFLFFSGSKDVAQFYGGIACVGFAFGALMGVFPGFTALQFGSKHNSVNYGIIFIGFAVSGYFGPTIMSAIRNATESYRLAFLVAICFTVGGLLLTFIYYRAVKVRITEPFPELG
jgi:MFS family permease